MSKLNSGAGPESLSRLVEVGDVENAECVRELSSGAGRTLEPVSALRSEIGFHIPQSAFRIPQ
jgi:hypothetical protein